MFRKDKMTNTFYLSSIIIGVIDVIAIIAFIILSVLIYLGIILSTKLFIVLAIILFILNLSEVVLITLYLKFRKD